MNLNKQAFTLVELIVVITILAILGTIAFISLQGYGRDARDSVRVSDMKNIEKGFELELTKRGKITKPEEEIEITASGTLIAYQGYATKNVLNKIGVHGGGKDPFDEKYYTYMTNVNLTKYQILGYLEGEEGLSLLEESYAVDLSNRYPNVLGSTLGVLLNSGSLNPVQDNLVSIDIVNTNEELVAYLDNENVVSGTGSELIKIKSSISNGIQKSCKDYLKKDKSLFGTYGVYIIDNGLGIFDEVYCDMSTDGGGWLLLMTANGYSSRFSNGSDEYINPNYDDKVNSNLEDIDYIGKSYTEYKTNIIKLCLVDLSHCYNFEHNMNISLNSFFTNEISYTKYSNEMATYDNVGIDILDDFVLGLGQISLTRRACQWLGINYVWDGISIGSLGILMDRDGGCKPNTSRPDNGAFGLGVNSGADVGNSYTHGYHPLNNAGQSQDINTALGNSILGPWFVFGK